MTHTEYLQNVFDALPKAQDGSPIIIGCTASIGKGDNPLGFVNGISDNGSRIMISMTFGQHGLRVSDLKDIVSTDQSFSKIKEIREFLAKAEQEKA